MRRAQQRAGSLRAKTAVRWGKLVPVAGPVEFADWAFEPERLKQRRVRDCWLMAGLMAVCSTSWGPNYLRGLFRWDEQAGGYWVRLYSGGRVGELLVTKVYSGMATIDKPGTGEVGPVNWVSLFEMAVFLARGARSSNLDYSVGNFGFDLVLGLNRPHRGRAMAAVLRLLPKPIPRVRVSRARPAGWAHASAGRVKRLLERGFLVTVGTLPVFLGPKPTRKLVYSGGPVSARHIYWVEKVLPNGSVVLRNPWGPTAANTPRPPVVLTARQFNRLFFGVFYAPGLNPAR